MFEILYNIFIMPIEIIVEIIFFAMYRQFSDFPGICIILVSIVVSTLVLPLYKKADAMQEVEREKQKKMKPWLDHIRKTFKGDERYMMQTTYYRIEGYKPFNAINGSLSLLFQVPFFIAAYHFLSHLDVLNGASFLMISDLGSPDGLIKIGGLAINLLPILMTTINIISGVIYTKGFSLKDKLQLYGMALVFLVLLYKSPSGLVLYWTCNNIYSLCKNIFAKYIKNTKLVLSIIIMLLGTGLFVTMGLTHRFVLRRDYLIFGTIMVLSWLPLILGFLYKKTKLPVLVEQIFNNISFDDKKTRNLLFILGVVFLTVFMGSLIPSSVVVSSPTEIGTLGTGGPFFLVFNTFSIFVGFFCLWIGIFYWIADEKIKDIFTIGLWLSACIGILDYYAFYGKFGDMTKELLFHKVPEFDDTSKIINIAAIAALIIVIMFLYIRYKKVVGALYQIIILMAIGLTILNLVKTSQILDEERYEESVVQKDYEEFIPLSREGKNVVVIMLDRAISEYIPYMFNEKPELASQFEDFVYYPNTVSYAGFTNMASPALFGGYEYTPAKINERSDESLASKQNEALSVMPVIFSNEGYEVTVCDPSYAGYKSIPDTTIYDAYDNINCQVTDGVYAGEYYKEFDDNNVAVQKRNFFVYSFFRTAPVALQNVVYDEGSYYGKGRNTTLVPNILKGYSVLAGMDKLCYITKEPQDTFLMMVNYTTHEPAMLKTPEYEISHDEDILPYSEERLAPYTIDGKTLKMDDIYGVAHYHANMLAFLELGKWFEYLKANDVYDNTRIILVSDHGRETNQLEGNRPDGWDTFTIETFAALMLVKDFADAPVNATDNLLGYDRVYVNDEFMTNADVPTLAFEGLVSDPVNPFSGDEINSDKKYSEPIRITTSPYYSIYEYGENLLPLEGHDWLEVTPGDIYDWNNWKIIPY